jgi:DNA (cytosine-5)-methyltransferase 1
VITAKTYYSGAGGFDLGLQQAGVEIVQSLEIEPERCETLRKNFDHPVVNADVSNVTVLDQPEADIYVGTWPCKKYSTIADIKGTRTGDELFLHFLRHVVLAQPEVYIIENVPGMKVFPIVMEAFTKLPDYYVHVMCPVDTTCWLPQRRDRLILFGSRRPMAVEAPNAPSRPHRVRSVLERSPDRKPLPPYVRKRLDGGYRDKPILVDPDGVAPTCLAHYGKDRGTRLVIDKKAPDGVRPFTVREYARLQGFPDDHEFVGSNRNVYGQIGDAVPVPMARWAAEQAVRHLRKAA